MISLEAFTKNTNYHHHVFEPWLDDVLKKFDEVVLENIEHKPHNKLDIPHIVEFWRA